METPATWIEYSDHLPVFGGAKLLWCYDYQPYAYAIDQHKCAPHEWNISQLHNDGTPPRQSRQSRNLLITDISDPGTRAACDVLLALALGAPSDVVEAGTVAVLLNSAGWRVGVTVAGGLELAWTSPVVTDGGIDALTARCLAWRFASALRIRTTQPASATTHT